MGIFDMNAGVEDRKRSKGWAMELALWAALFDFWMFIVAGAGTGLFVIGIMSSGTFAVVGAAVNLIPVVGQIVAGVVAILGLATGATNMLIGLGISFFAGMLSVIFSMILNGLFRRHSIHALGKGFEMRMVYLTVGRIIPGINLLPFFTIFTALMISQTLQEDRAKGRESAS